MGRTRRNRYVGPVLLAAMLLGAPSLTSAQSPPADPGTSGAAATQAQPPAKSTFEVYGFAMFDGGIDFKRIHPDWFDTMRVTKLPSFEDEFGKDRNVFAGLRQSRFGVRSSTPT